MITLIWKKKLLMHDIYKIMGFSWDSFRFLNHFWDKQTLIKKASFTFQLLPDSIYTPWRGFPAKWKNRFVKISHFCIFVSPKIFPFFVLRLERNAKIFVFCSNFSLICLAKQNLCKLREKCKINKNKFKILHRFHFFSLRSFSRKNGFPGKPSC